MVSGPQEVSAYPEEILYEAVHGCEALHLGGRLEAPHLTLARFEPPRPPEGLRAAIQESAPRELGSVRTNQFHLIESKLKSSGAEYTTLESFLFAAAEA